MNRYAVVFAPQVEEHLATIHDYIARTSKNRAKAARLVNGIVSWCESLAVFPQRSIRRDELQPGLRLIRYRRGVTVAFHLDESAEAVLILGVFYGGHHLEGSPIEHAADAGR